MEEQEKNKALWFSRHVPTKEQLAEINSLGYDIEIELGIVEGQKNLTKENEREYLANFLKLSTKYDTFFGVFPAKLRSIIFKNNLCNIWEAWNEQRTVEGQKPTFSHVEFCQTFEKNN